MRRISIAMCVVLLWVNISGTALQVEAATAVPLAKIIDMCLSKTGIFAQESYIDTMGQSMKNMLNGTAESYIEYCDKNGLSINQESWLQYNNSEEFAGLGFLLPSWLITSDIWLEYVSAGVSNFTDAQIARMLLNGQEIEAGEKYTISDDVVDSVRDDFDKFISTESLGYYYVDTLTANELPTDYFNDSVSYKNVKDYISGSDNITYMFIYLGDSIESTQTYMFICDNGYDYLFVRPEGDYQTLTVYRNDWTVHTGKGFHVTPNSQIPVFDSSTYDDLAQFNDYTHSYQVNFHPTIESNKRSFLIFTKSGNTIPIYESYEALKTYNGGNKPYYVNTNNNYDQSNDNSLEFTGDYIIKNGTEMSYDIIREEIDNSVDNSDHSVGTIINDMSTTIINNYYGGGSGSGEGEDDSSGSGDGIESFFDGILALIDFILDLLGKAIQAITTLVSGVLELITSLTGSFSGFAALIGAIFEFLPPEVIDILTLGITAVVALGIIKMIRG